jgi:hypothetical protein
VLPTHTAKAKAGRNPPLDEKYNLFSLYNRLIFG